MMSTGNIKQGRPPLPESQRLRHASFRLDAESAGALEALAEYWGQGKSAVVRRLLIERSRRLRLTRE